MKIKPHKNKTVRKLHKFDVNILKKISPKKVISAILLIALVSVGIYGTAIGVKEKIDDKKLQENITTTEAPVINLKGKEKTFNVNGVKITLTDRFEIFEDPEIIAGFVSEGIEVYIVNDTFDDVPEFKDYTEYEFAQYLVEGDDTSKITEIDGEVYVEYIFDSDKGIIQAYFVKISKISNGFLLSHFITNNADALAYKEHIIKWAKTIEYVGVEETE